MVERGECDRCHRVVPCGDTECITFYSDIWEGKVDTELCKDCLRRAKQWLKAYLENKEC